LVSHLIGKAICRAGRTGGTDQGVLWAEEGEHEHERERQSNPYCGQQQALDDRQPDTAR
jgi:hypothetical protein